jgi:hypothetical protein
MFKLEDLKIETLNDYIKHLFIVDNLKRDILLKVKEINKKLTSDEMVIVKTTKDGDNKFNIIISVINNTLPKCYVVNNEYKFNSYIAHIINVCDLKTKK